MLFLLCFGFLLNAVVRFRDLLFLVSVLLVRSALCLSLSGLFLGVIFGLGGPYTTFLVVFLGFLYVCLGFGLCLCGLLMRLLKKYSKSHVCMFAEV